LKKKPLENLSLPTDFIFETCLQAVQDKGYNLRSEKKVEGFFDTAQNLESKFIDSIEFKHLIRQREAEKLENHLFPDEEDGQEAHEEKDLEEEEEEIMDDQGNDENTMVIDSKKKRKNLKNRILTLF